MFFSMYTFYLERSKLEILILSIKFTLLGIKLLFLSTVIILFSSLKTQIYFFDEVHWTQSSEIL